MARRHAGPWVAVGYVLLSVAGWLWAGRLFDLAPMAYILAQWILGPVAFAWSLGLGIFSASQFQLWIVFYLAATLLLIGCALLSRRRVRWIRITAILLAVVTWLASGFMNFVAMFAGI